MKSVICQFVCLLSIVAATTLDKQPTKRSYACPPKFVRLSHRCYFFSNEKATWQDAFFQCHSMHSSLAIIRNSNQDKLIRKTLSRKTLEPLERWLGGRYDWQRKQWKWAASGKPLTYKGFDRSVDQDEKRLNWHCIVTDPALQYRWNDRSCFEKKHFICHKKIHTITNKKSRDKLLHQYNTNKLNEILVPEAPGGLEDLKSHQRVQQRAPDPFHVEIYPFAGDGNSDYIYKKKKRKGTKKNLRPLSVAQLSNGTLYENNISPAVLMSDQPYRRRRNRTKEEEKTSFKMYYKTYKEGSRGKHPLHPSPIVEEYNIVKSA